MDLEDRHMDDYEILVLDGRIRVGKDKIFIYSMTTADSLTTFANQN
jgi:hypothetical protein